MPYEYIQHTRKNERILASLKAQCLTIGQDTVYPPVYGPILRRWWEFCLVPPVGLVNLAELDLYPTALGVAGHTSW